MILKFTVAGEAQPAGSKKGYSRGGRVIIVDDNPKAAPWKGVVAGVARGKMLAARIEPPLFPDQPLEVTMTFRRVRPKSHLNTKGEPNANGRQWPMPSMRPDVLKLARGVEDAMTEIVYKDDAQIVREHLVKEWGDRDEVVVTVQPIDMAAEELLKQFGMSRAGAYEEVI